LTNQFGGVHGNKTGAATMQWRNKPLFRRTGDIKFKTGTEAAELLVAEVLLNNKPESSFKCAQCLLGLRRKGNRISYLF